MTKRKARFMNHLDVRVIEEKRPFKLLADFTFYSAVLGRELTVPKGYTTDFASVPWWSKWYIDVNGKSRRPAVVHDFGCDHPEAWGLSQKQVDELFREGLDVARVRPTLASAMFLSVAGYQWGKSLAGKRKYSEEAA